MAALRRHDGRFHAARATADHHHPLRRIHSAFPVVLQLPSGFRVLNAGDRKPLEAVAYTGLIAADARADVLRPAFARLPCEFRVRDVAAHDAHHVGLTRCNDPLRVLRLVHAAGNHHRQRDRVLHLPAERRETGVRHHHVRNDVEPARV